MIDRAVLIQRLAEAEEAYHQLSMGKSIVELKDSNGETVKYGQASARQLGMYIATLRAQLGCGGSRPMEVWF